MPNNTNFGNFNISSLGDMLNDNIQKVINIPLEQIEPDPEQVRKNHNTGFQEENLVELKESIQEIGVQQPIIVKKEGSKYKIICGERRYRASKLAALETIPAIEVKSNLTDQQILIIQLTENIQRVDLDVIEVAEAVKILKQEGLRNSEIAKKLGKSDSFISMLLPFFDIDDKIKFYFKNGKVSKSIRPGYELIQLYKTNPEIVLEYLGNLKDNEIFSRADVPLLKNYIIEKKQETTSIHNNDITNYISNEKLDDSSHAQGEIDQNYDVIEEDEYSYTNNDKESDYSNDQHYEEEKETPSKIWLRPEDSKEKKEKTGDNDNNQDKINKKPELLVSYDGNEYSWNLEKLNDDDKFIIISNVECNLTIKVKLSDIKLLRWK